MPRDMQTNKEEITTKEKKAKKKRSDKVSGKIAAGKERKAARDEAQRVVDFWKGVINTTAKSKKDAEAQRLADIAKQEAERAEAEAKQREAKQEEQRKEAEALNGIPDYSEDTPADARTRGYRRVAGHKVERQQALQPKQGKPITIKFAEESIIPGHAVIIDASLLQPSHLQGVRNPQHFIDEAQPKDRTDQASIHNAQRIAQNIRPEEITSNITAYTGAPTVNARGEVIQGNNRSDALRYMWESEKEQAAIYKEYLKEHASEYVMTAEEIEAMEQPVVVNMLNVSDAEAIQLGQYVATDTESGGIERIKPKNAVQKMGNNMKSFANSLHKSKEEEA